uniref:TIL domain-containing protein n=1 Tax=Anopheles minimus TaxID=112268 RepID=A0A182W0R9_9DIPT
MHLYGKLCSLFLLFVWCNVAFAAVAPNIPVCPTYEEFAYSFECQATCAARTCPNTNDSPKREACVCKLGYIRQYAKGPCIRNSRCSF